VRESFISSDIILYDAITAVQEKHNKALRQYAILKARSPGGNINDGTTCEQGPYRSVSIIVYF